MLRCIQRTETDPYYNLAAEEYLLKNATIDTFMTWRNEPSVIIGKHQITSKEINHNFIESRHLPVIRRISGGGAVYHDPGNINFSFIYTNRQDNLIDFRYFTEPIIFFLRELGLDARFEGKSSITVDGLKVSGNSAHIFRNKVLHHGTLLLDTDLNELAMAIAGHRENYTDKSVSSVMAEVADISSFLSQKLTVDEFNSMFNSFIFKNNPGSYDDNLNHTEKEAIVKLAEEKYKKIEWNFGYSPDYIFDNVWMIHDSKYSVSLVVNKGLIRNALISGPDSYSPLLKTLSDELSGAYHEKNSVSEKLKKVTFANVMEEQILYQFLHHLF